MARTPKEIEVKLKLSRPVAQLVQGRRDWYRIDNKSSKVADIYIYDEIGYFSITAQDFVKDLQGLNPETINLHINSPGGDVFDGIAIYNALLDHRATVNVNIDSLAASIASVIAMAGDTRTIAKAGTMMIHDGHGLSIGNAADMREMADLLDKMSDTIAGVYADRAGGDVKSWRTAMKDESWYTAEEAVAAGLADEVRGGEESAENSWDLSIFAYAGRKHAPAPAVAAKAEPEFSFDPELFRTAFKEVYG
jgi:ATP-dependent protease ClpP protease subunit